MAGPGGREVGRVSIRVVPDTSEFPDELRASLARIERTLKVEIPAILDGRGIAADARNLTREGQLAAGKVTIPVEYDRKGLANLGKSIDRVSQAGGGSGGDKLLLGRSKLFLTLGVAAAISAPNILSLAGSLAQVSGAAALAPAVFGAAAVGVGALAIGFSHVADALGPRDTTAQIKKVNEAVADLAPQARTAVAAVRGLAPAFAGLRLDVQGRLFEGVGQSIQKVGAVYLPILRGGFGRVADQFNAMFRDFAKFALLRQTIEDTRAILDRFSDAFAGLSGSTGPLLSALRDITAVGATFLAPLAAGFSEMAARFATFIANARQTGSLGTFIASGLSALGDLAKIAGAAASAVLGIVKAAQAAGGGTLAALAGGLQGVAKVINGPAFQSGLITFFTGLQAGFSGLTGALPSIGAALAAIAPAIASVAQGLGEGLGAALRVVADLVIALAPTINAAAALFAEFAPQIVGVALAVAAVVRSVAVAQPVIAGLAVLFGTTAGPVIAVLAAITALVAGFVLLYQRSSAVRDAVAQVVAGFRGMYAAVVPIVQQVLGVISQNFPQISAIATQVFGTVRDIVIAVMTAIHAQITAVTFAVRAVWSVFGSTILATIQRVFPAILTIIQGVLNVIQGAVRAFTAVLRGDWSGAWAAVQQIVRGAWQIISGVVRAGLGLIRGAISAQLIAIRGVFSAAWSAVASAVAGAFARIRSSVAAGIAGVISTVASLPGRILSAIGNLGGLLYSAGGALISGLARGIIDRIGAVTAAASRVAQAIKDKFPGSPVKSGPLTSWNNGGAGKRLTEMLASGIVDGTPHVERVTARMAARIGAAAPVIEGGGVGGAAGVGQQTVLSGNVFYSYDPTDILREADLAARDAASVSNLRALVGVG